MKLFLVVILFFGLAAAVIADIKGHRFNRRPGIKIRDKPTKRAGVIKLSHHDRRFTSSGSTASAMFPSFPVPADGMFFEARRRRRESQHIDLVSLIRYLNARNAERISNQMASNNYTTDKIYYPLPKPNILEMLSGKHTEGLDQVSESRSTRSVQIELISAPQGQKHSSPHVPTKSTDRNWVDRSKSQDSAQAVLHGADNLGTRVKRDADDYRTQENVNETYSAGSRSGKSVFIRSGSVALDIAKARREIPKQHRNDRTMESYEKRDYRQKLKAPYLIDVRGQISQTDESGEKVTDKAVLAEPHTTLKPFVSSLDNSDLKDDADEYSDVAGKLFYANMAGILPKSNRVLPFDVHSEKDNSDSAQLEVNERASDAVSIPNRVTFKSPLGYEAYKKLKQMVLELLKADLETAQRYRELEIKSEGNDEKEIHEDTPCITCNTGPTNFPVSHCKSHPCSESDMEPENPAIDPFSVLGNIIQQLLLKEADVAAELLQMAEQDIFNMFQTQTVGVPTLGGISESYTSIEPPIRFSTFVHFVPYHGEVAPRAESNVAGGTVFPGYLLPLPFMNPQEKWIKEFDQHIPRVLSLAENIPVRGGNEYTSSLPPKHSMNEHPSDNVMSMIRTQNGADKTHEQTRQRTKRQVYVQTAFPEDIQYNASTNMLTILVPVPDMVVTKTELKFDTKASAPESAEQKVKNQTTESEEAGDSPKKQRRRILADIIAKLPDAEKIGKALKERIADVHSLSSSDIRNVFRGGRRFDGYPSTGFQGEFVFPSTFVV